MGRERGEPVGHQWRQQQGAEQYAQRHRPFAQQAAEQQVERQRHRKERQPDGHALFPTRRTMQGIAEPGVETADAVLMGLGEQTAAALQSGSP